MIEVYPNLFVGDENDAMNRPKDMYFIGAAKYPYHKEHARADGAEQEGYVGKALPANNVEYLMAQRDNAVYCNLIDVDNPAYIPEEILYACLEAIKENIYDGYDVLVCCNKGESRAPSIAFMYMIQQGAFDKYIAFEDALTEFKTKYPSYNPKAGMMFYVRKIWTLHKLKGEKING